MKKDQGFFDYIYYDYLIHIPGVSYKPMFGGWGFYKEGLIFAIIADGKLFFKVGQTNIQDYLDANSEQFSYPMKNGKVSSLNYYELPEDILNSPELSIWIEKSVALHQKS